MRRECPEISWGTWKALNVRTDRVLALRYDWDSRTSVFLHNFGEKPCAVRLHVDAPRGNVLVDLLGQTESHADESGRHTIDLEPWGYRWFRAGSLNVVGPARDA